ncbi:hypothetical protein Droror1_Dr00021713 [Drosera rotundifolia]
MFEVVDQKRTHVVDLLERKCNCRVWQVNGIPCKHVCACIEATGEALHGYCDSYFTIESYKITYKEIFNPMPNGPQSTEFQHNHIPNPINLSNVPTQPGGRRTRRIPSQVVLRPVKIYATQRQGHKRRTCHNPIEEE